jgi:hypothetical protein
MIWSFLVLWICTGLKWLRIWFIVNTITSVRVVWKENNFLIIWTTLHFLHSSCCVIYGYYYLKIWDPVYTAIVLQTVIFPHDATDRIGPRPPHYWGFTITIRHTYTHTYTHTRQGSSGRMIGQKQRPLPHNTQHSQETDIHALGRIRTRIPSKQTTSDPLLKPRGHWDRLQSVIPGYIWQLAYTVTNLQISAKKIAIST